MMRAVFAVVPLLLLVAAGSVGAEDIAAQVVWGKRAELGFVRDGVVQGVVVNQGQRVKRGDLLVTLEADAQRLAVESAGSALKAAGLRRDEAGRELERALELYDQTVLSDHDRQVAEIGAAEAEAAWQASRARHAEALQRYEQTRLRAGFDGLVVVLSAVEGEAVVNGLQAQPLVVLADDSQLIARGRLTLDQVKGMSDDGISLALQGEILPGRIQLIGFEPEAQSKETVYYRLDVAFQRPSEMVVRAGEPVIIRLAE